MLDVSELRKSYDGTPAVRGLTFAVPAGEVLGLVGPNGAGKTSTLRCIAGILRPTGGRVAIDGIDLAADPVHAKRRLAFVPDEPHLFEYLTVEEHLRFIARLYGVSDAESKAAALLEELELTPKRRALPDELSRGMKQKLAIACGLLHDPQVLLLDEPLTGLDPVGIRRMKATIAARAKSGVAVVLSSHLLHLVEQLCTRLLVVRLGRMVAYGTIDEIVGARPELAGLPLEELFVALTEGDVSSAITA